jgi:hypothetical protein
MYLLRRAVYLDIRLDVIARRVVASDGYVECYLDIPAAVRKSYELQF